MQITLFPDHVDEVRISTAKPASSSAHQSLIIHQIPFDVNFEDMKESLEETLRISCAKKVTRMFHRSGLPIASIRVNFTTSDIVASLLEDGFVNMLFGHHPVKEYHMPQRVFTCFNCHQHGHIAKDCRNKVICARCGTEHLGPCEAAKLHCVNCKGEHFPGQSICLEVQKICQQKNLSRMYAQVTISLPNSFSTTAPPTMATNVSSQSTSAPPPDTQISLSDLVFFNKRFNEMKSFFCEIIERLTAKLDEQQRQLDELGPIKNLVEKTIREKEELAKHIRKNLSEPVR